VNGRKIRVPRNFAGPVDDDDDDDDDDDGDDVNL